MQCSDGRNYISVQVGPQTFDHHEVTPESVGVCSGWTDENGKVVFEGDWVVSCFGRKYRIEMVNGGLRAVGETGFYYEFGHLCRPVVVEN